MKTKLYPLFSFCVVFLSCVRNQTVYNQTDNIEELGNNYYYLGDSNESQILLNLKPENKSKFGKTIIPPEVIEYNFNNDFIIAKTLEMIDNNKNYKYWIVDKQRNKDSIEPLDSINFFKALDNLNLNIKFKKRK
jgi:hypothetical protein